MKNKNNIGSVFIALAFAIPLSVYVNCKQDQNTEVQSVVSRPQPEAIVVEHKTQFEMVEADEPETPQEETQEQNESLGEFKLTAYCPCEKCCGKWAENRPIDEEGNQIVIGASGEELVEGISIAVDSSVIPYGSTVIINGKTYIAHDCGGAIKQNRIDVYMASHQEALEFGVQYAEVILKKEGAVDGFEFDL